MTTRRKPLPSNSELHSFDHDPGPTRSLKAVRSTPVLGPRSTSNTLNKPQASDDAYDDFLESYYCSSPDDDRPVLHQEYDSHHAWPHHSQSSPSAADHESELNDPVRLPNANAAQQSLAPASSPSPERSGHSKQTEPSTSLKARLKVVTALEETSIFLGGLIKHPTESNRHFTILRHSHGLVYYKGPGTSVAISIFSDRPLPADRRMWLQLKGWTGNTGMAAKALFRSNNSWINVTPEQQVDAVSLPPLDERAWQRDIKKFNSKASKAQQKHVLRETAVVRIPYEASDGYFRIVLTGSESKAVFCPSPVFRVASTSMSASSLKGASLSTLPIELGVKVAQTAATTMASTVISPWVGVVKDRVASAAPVMQYAGYAQTAWDTSGMQDRVDTVNEQYEERQAATAAAQLALDRTLSTPTSTRSNIVGSDDGPELPFPLRLKGIIAQGTGQSTLAYGMPTANLNDVPPDLLGSMSLGTYFGWAQVKSDNKEPFLQQEWCHAIISITYSDTTNVARRKCVRAYLIYDFTVGTSFVGSKLKLVIMGYLRPLLPACERDVILLESVNDIAITRASLSRPAWGHEEVLHRVKTAQSARSMTERMVDLRIAGQRHADRVPVHMLGVRSDSSGVYDRGMYGNGGVWVKRD